MKEQKLKPNLINLFPEQPEPCDSELFKSSREWSPEQWEQYLVTIEAPLIEEQLHPNLYDKLAENPYFIIFDFAQGSASQAVIEHVRKLLDRLTGRQREVVELLFYSSMSERAVAQELGISRNAVVKLKARSLRHLRRLLAAGVSTFPLVRGLKKKPEESND